MIREFAFGLGRRHYFEDSSNIVNWMEIHSDTYMSLYEYDDDVKDYFAENKKLAGYDGKVYIPEEFILDVDGGNPDDAQKKAIALKLHLDDLDVPFKAFFSGTGFHFHIPSSAFTYRPHKNLHMKVKEVLTKHGIFEYADPSVTDKLRLIRIPNTKNTKSGYYKVELKNGMLEGDIREIVEYSMKTQPLTNNTLECQPVFNVLISEEEVKQTTNIQVSQGRSPDPSLYPCISGMMQSIPMGKRHMVALRLSAWFRWLYPEDTVRMLMETWRRQVSGLDKPFSTKEMESIVTSAYEGHNGQGNKYGCSDPIMDEYCKNTCRLYRNKRSQTMMDASDMENNLIEFYKSDVTPLNIGHLYGGDFPIYPGEVVILQAPPKSMKTMLLQNWMCAFKVPTYFLEMEMSPRQIWSRFVMIANNWTEDQLISHYKSGNGKLKDQFNWLKVDFSSPYPNELEKRIITQPVMPELVIVDHIGLLRSKQKDNNMKVEEASQALMEIAVKHNIVVFAVSEINKSAFKEGMDMASSRGSFRIAYNANKLLSLSPYKNKETGLIEMLNVKSDKNREKEYLNVNLTVNNVRITNAT